MKEPTPIVAVPLPPPSLGPKKPVVPQNEQTQLATAAASPTTVTVGCAASPLTNNKSKVSSKSNTSRYPKMPPGPRPVIEKPRKNDVLFGRGSQIALHPGNVQFREIVWQEKDEYQRTRNAGIKRDVALHVIGLVRELEPPGRFLELAGTSIMDGPWVESTPERILEKTSQGREDCWHSCSACALVIFSTTLTSISCAFFTPGVTSYFSAMNVLFGIDNIITLTKQYFSSARAEVALGEQNGHGYGRRADDRARRIPASWPRSKLFTMVVFG
jgi:hypothetical protein